MVVGAVLEVARSIVAVLDMGNLRDLMREDLATDPTFSPDEAEAFVDIMMVFLVGVFGFFLILTLGLWVWMAVVNRRGRQWARVTATVLGGTSISMSALELALRPLMSSQPEVFGPQVTTGATYAVVSGTYLAIIVAILVLLWLPASNAYVRDVSAQSHWERWARRFGRPGHQ